MSTTTRKRGNGLEVKSTVEGDGDALIANLSSALLHPKDFPVTRSMLAGMIDSGEVMLLPTTITAENGCRAALEKEFDVPWDVMQAIYRKLVEHFELR
jgi:hypothetical protein